MRHTAGVGICTALAVSALSGLGPAAVGSARAATAPRPAARGAAPQFVRTRASWAYKGVSIIPNSPTDPASSDFDASVLEARRDGANTVCIIVQYQQASLTSSRITDSPTTPTRAALRRAIAFVHALRMKVAFKVFYDVQGTAPPWRWYIHPRNRSAWFSQATRLEVGLARLHPDLLIVGTEDGELSEARFSPDNTPGWIDLIKSVRRVYRGPLTYEAQTPSAPPYGTEAANISFWSYLDFVMVSGYNDLNVACDATAAQIDQAWSRIRARWYRPLEQKLGLPIDFGEVGYSSYRCDLRAPWQYYADATAPQLDLSEQAVAYQAFFRSWSRVPYVDGLIWWNWLPSPDAGGVDNLDFTPQNKPAEAVLQAGFTDRPTAPYRLPTPTPTP